MVQTELEPCKICAGTDYCSLHRVAQPLENRKIIKRLPGLLLSGNGEAFYARNERTVNQVISILTRKERQLSTDLLSFCAAPGIA